MTIVKLTSVASTNKYCEVLDLSQVEDFTCFWALEQTAGIGQRGNHWHSEPGKNLTFSLILHPTFLPANQQFKLTQTLSLAIVDFITSIFNSQFSIKEQPSTVNCQLSTAPPLTPPLHSQTSLPSSLPANQLSTVNCQPSTINPSPFQFSIFNFQFPFTPPNQPSTVNCQLSTANRLSTKIKWPNDIYADNKKICGTLISAHLSTLNSHLSLPLTPSHSLSLPPSSHLSSAVCGIGLNVNQTAFPDWVPNPTSLKLLTSQDYDLEPLLQRLLQCIQARYEALRRGIDMQQEYLGHLMNLGVPAKYLYQGNEIEATITGVDAHGRLLLTAADGRRLSCGMKEIAFCL